MTILGRIAVSFLILSFLSIIGCLTSVEPTGVARSPSDKPRFTAEEAPEWTDLFNRTSGWFGGDGIFSIPLSASEKHHGRQGKTLLLFSDTMIGEIEAGVLKDGSVMVNNTVALLEGNEPKDENIQFYWTSDDARPATMFVPKTPRSRPEDWYWLGDGFVNKALNDSIYVLAYRMEKVGKESWDFGVDGVTLIVLPPDSPPPFEDHRQYDTPLHRSASASEPAITFGAGVLPNVDWADVPNPDGYVYVYGIREQNKSLVAARVRPEHFNNFRMWRFWDGQGWADKVEAAASITNQLSNELSVTPLPDGRYLLVFQLDGVTPNVAVRVGDSPVGPFGPVQTVWRSKEVEEDEDYLAYNAKAHPHLSAPGKLLISYNINSYDFGTDIQADPDLYRPRFIWLTY